MHLIIQGKKYSSQLMEMPASMQMLGKVWPIKWLHMAFDSLDWGMI